MKQCKYCGSKKNLQEHHLLGRNDKNSELPENKVFYCFKCHNVAECRDYIKLPFTSYSIQGKLFDIYVKSGGNIEKILNLIKLKKFKKLWKNS